MNIKKEEYITLKEAAEISGYSSDYLGQLIRQGKLTGKQVFSQVSWVTTEDALHSYMQNGKATSSATRSSIFKNIKGQFLTPEFMSFLYIAAARGVAIVLLFFALFLMYVFSVNIDHRVDKTLSERSEYAP